MGVKTTGVFCRPTCPARKPKFENCEFYKTAGEALLASFRPCMRCRPLSHPNQVSDLVRRLVDAVEADPSRRWKDRDFEELSVDASTARRQFKKRFGMTFVEMLNYSPIDSNGEKQDTSPKFLCSDISFVFLYYLGFYQT